MFITFKDGGFAGVLRYPVEVINGTVVRIDRLSQQGWYFTLLRSNRDREKAVPCIGYDEETRWRVREERDKATENKRKSTRNMRNG